MSFVRMYFAANTRNEIQRFISFDEIGVLCKLRRLRNTRKASERVVVTRTYYSVSVRRVMPISSLEALTSVIFVPKQLPCHTIAIF